MWLRHSQVRLQDPGVLAASAHCRGVSVRRNETVRERVAPALYRREDVAETLTGTSSGSRCS
ncbi:MAG TPA: hypothetical protein PLV96_09915, partial [Methanoregulaceae archaeon]|nr:hypothetical protein [Methanoregulaceae archaeon]